MIEGKVGAVIPVGQSQYQLIKLTQRKQLLEQVRRIYRDHGFKQKSVCILLINTIEEIIDANSLRV